MATDRELLAQALPFMSHRNKRWVSDHANAWHPRHGTDGHWEGLQCVLTDSFDQSGDTRCSCGRDALVAQINRQLQAS